MQAVDSSTGPARRPVNRSRCCHPSFAAPRRQPPHCWCSSGRWPTIGPRPFCGSFPCMGRGNRQAACPDRDSIGVDGHTDAADTRRMARPRVRVRCNRHIVRASALDAPGVSVFNVGSGTAISNEAVVRAVEHVTGRPVPVLSKAAPPRVCDRATASGRHGGGGLWPGLARNDEPARRPSPSRSAGSMHIPMRG